MTTPQAASALPGTALRERWLPLEFGVRVDLAADRALEAPWRVRDPRRHGHWLLLMAWSHPHVSLRRALSQAVDQVPSGGATHDQATTNGGTTGNSRRRVFAT